MAPLVNMTSSAQGCFVSEEFHVAYAGLMFLLGAIGAILVHYLDRIANALEKDNEPK
jgi:hypothetical protein